jgi:Outer membrane protein beta-barrel domain
VGARPYFGNQIQSFGIDPVYNFTPRGSRIRPYVTAGIGPTWFVPTNKARAQAAVNTSAEFAFNYGGGVKYHLSPHLGLRLDARGFFSQNPTFGLVNVPKAHLNGVQATLGLVFYFRQKHVAAPPPPPEPPQRTLQPLNPGEITGAAGQLCEGRVLTLHATATDPAGHTLAYAWKANGQSVGTSNPDLSFTPNNAGDFQFEVEVSDTSDPARIVRVGPKTLSIRDYVLPKISGVTASPNTINITSDSPTHQTAILAADVAASSCGGNLTYKWTVSEGSLTNDVGPSAVFDSASLNFDSSIGQTKTITATVTATDETGKSASQSTTISVNYPALYKRLPDVIFAKNSWRVNNCGKRILIEQAAPQAGTAYDILLVGHRSKDEPEVVEVGTGRKRRKSTLDQLRLLATAAVLTGDHRVCGNLDVSQMRISAAGIEQISEPDPGLCGTSNLKPTAERTDAIVSDADKDRRVEVYLIPKGSQSLPPAAKNAVVAAASAVKDLGCPK